MKTRVRIQYQPLYPAYIAKAPKTLRLPDSPPRVLPFNKDTAHTIPTRWGLYRALLRRAGRSSSPGHREDAEVVQPGEGSESRTDEQPSHIGPTPAEAGTSSSSDSRWPHVYQMVRADWRSQHHNTSIVQARHFLTYYYSILSHLESSSSESQSQLRDIETMAEKTIATHREEEERLHAEQEALRESRRNARGRLTGGFLYPTQFLPPLPKMVPQPPKISGMYRARLHRRDLRIRRLRDIDESISDIKEEIRFLSSLGPSKVNGDWDLYGPGGWITSHEAYRAECAAKLAIEEARAKMLFTEEVVLKVRSARRERHKTYMSFAPQRREKKMANGLKRKKEREAFIKNRERNRELKAERLKRMEEGTQIPAGRKGMYWDVENGGGYRRKKRPVPSGAPKMSLQGFLAKKEGT